MRLKRAHGSWLFEKNQYRCDANVFDEEKKAREQLVRGVHMLSSLSTETCRQAAHILHHPQNPQPGFSAEAQLLPYVRHCNFLRVGRVGNSA